MVRKLAATPIDEALKPSKLYTLTYPAFFLRVTLGIIIPWPEGPLGLRALTAAE
jgi:hypothetical protein